MWNQETARRRSLCSFGGLVLGLRELGDIGPGILEGDELASARQRDRFIERPFPALG